MVILWFIMAYYGTNNRQVPPRFIRCVALCHRGSSVASARHAEDDGDQQEHDGGRPYLVHSTTGETERCEENPASLEEVQ